MKSAISKSLALATAFHAAIVLSGCAETTYLEEGLSAEAEGALLSENSLITNAIDLNGLTANAIDLNGLDPDLLSTEVRTALGDAGQLGANTRTLYKYLVSCALDPSQSISFSWTDSLNVVHQELFWGDLGLAPTWKNTSINKPGRRSVSACMAARSNFLGLTVTISVRGPQQSIKSVSAAELAAYPQEEGAFWGDLFDGTPQLYACHKGANITHSRSKIRYCAAGFPFTVSYLECAYIHIVGDCDSLCDPLDSTNFYRPRCDDNEIGSATTDVITVFLQP